MYLVRSTRSKDKIGLTIYKNFIHLTVNQWIVYIKKENTIKDECEMLLDEET